MSNRPSIVTIGRLDLKTSPAAKNVKTETVSIAGNQTDKGSRFSSVRNSNAVEQNQAKNAEVEDNAKPEPVAHDESGSSAAETELLQKEKKFSGRCRLFVGNLPNDLTENEFQKFFEPFGELSEVFLNAARGFGFLRLVSIFFAVVNYGFGSPKKDGLIDNISVRICTVKCSDFHSFHTNSCKRTLNVKKRI